MVNRESQLRARSIALPQGEGRTSEEIKGPWVARAMSMALPQLRRSAHHLSGTLQRDRYNGSNGLRGKKVEVSLPKTK